MSSAIEVTPQKWSAITVLFDNGEYSVISGLYDGGASRALGERWNGADDSVGFPSMGGNPLWHVVPDFLEVPLLHGILNELLRNPSRGNREYAAAIIHELEAFLTV